MAIFGPAPLIQPFALDFERYGWHIMLYFEGHPRYESVEAMLRERAGQQPLIRAILTRHDQTQIHYLNDDAMMQGMAASPPALQYAAMTCCHSVGNGRPRARLSFCTSEGEEIDIDLRAAGKPSPKYAGLTAPGGHAATSALPVMYRESSTLAHPKSRLRIDGRAYAIPRKAWVPLFFTGMKGYYSANWCHGVLRAFARQPVSLESAPAELVPGAQWRYRWGDRQRSYTVVSVEGSRVVAEGLRERVLLERLEDQLRLAEVQRQASDGHSALHLRFTSAMPLLGGDAGPPWQGEFAVGIDTHDNLLAGRIRLDRRGDGDYLHMRPNTPDWAAARPLTLALRTEGGQTYLSGAIGNPAVLAAGER